MCSTAGIRATYAARKQPQERVSKRVLAEARRPVECPVKPRRLIIVHRANDIDVELAVTAIALARTDG